MLLCERKKEKLHYISYTNFIFEVININSWQIWHFEVQGILLYTYPYFTLAYIFYNKTLSQIQYHLLVQRLGIHTHCICHKSTNSAFLCILSKDDYKWCRLFDLHHYHSHHWHHWLLFCYFSASESTPINKLCFDTLAFYFASLVPASSCSRLRVLLVLFRTSPVFACFDLSFSLTLCVS